MLESVKVWFFGLFNAGLGIELIGGTVFFALEILLLLILVPFLLRAHENKKWEAMRGGYSWSFAGFRDNIADHTDLFVLMLSRTPLAQENARRLAIQIEQEYDALNTRIDLLSPSLTPEMSSHIMHILAAADKVRSILSLSLELYATKRSHMITCEMMDTARDQCAVFDKHFVALNEIAPPSLEAKYSEGLLGQSARNIFPCLSTHKSTVPVPPCYRRAENIAPVYPSSKTNHATISPLAACA